MRDPEFTARIRFNSIYEVYMERGGLIRQTSLIVDPPDGRLPALTPRAQARHDEFVARWQGLHASWEDTNMYERCITRGRWEGDTLVVETTNFTSKAEQRAHYLVVTAFSTGKNLHLVERFTRTDADTIDYRFTVTVTSSGVVRMESSA